MKSVLKICLVALLLNGCATGYTLVKPSVVKVANGSMKVEPANAWNKAPRTALDVPQEENWTQNGPVLDVVTFIGAVKDGQAIVKQRAKDDQKVPVFRSNMTPQDLVSMVESMYRIRARATVFEAVEVNPATFLHAQGVDFTFNYVGADEVKRRGRALLAVVEGQLYLMSLDAAALHYYDAALPDFIGMAASASKG